MLEITDSGLQITVQDLGRPGFRHIGIPQSGAMDNFSAILANKLVGNHKDDPLLEIAGCRGGFTFTSNGLVAVTGADALVTLNDQPVELNHILSISKYDVLKLSPGKSGFYNYLAIRGILNCDRFLKSCSTYLPLKFGGHNGARLQKGDRIKWTEKSVDTSFKPARHLIPEFNSPHIIRVLEGPEFHLLQNTEFFWSLDFRISRRSNRMGYFFESAPIMATKKEIITSPVSCGTIQLLPDGQLVALMRDGHVSGGYPRIASVINADISRLAQVRPGDTIMLRKVSLKDAIGLTEYQRSILRLP